MGQRQTIKWTLYRVKKIVTIHGSAQQNSFIISIIFNLKLYTTNSPRMILC